MEKIIHTTHFPIIRSPSKMNIPTSPFLYPPPFERRGHRYLFIGCNLKHTRKSRYSIHSDAIPYTLVRIGSLLVLLSYEQSALKRKESWYSIPVTCFVYVRNLYACATLHHLKAFSHYSATKTLLQEFLNCMAKPKGHINKPKINDF